MATTTNQHMAARGDTELIARFIAKAEMMGIENPANFIQSKMPQLVTQTAEGAQTIADVHAYADDVRRLYIEATPPTPGSNLAAVTDAYLEAAILAVQALEPPA